MDIGTEINFDLIQAYYAMMGIILNHPEVLIDAKCEEERPKRIFESNNKLSIVISYEENPELIRDIDTFLSLSQYQLKRRIETLENLRSLHERQGSTEQKGSSSDIGTGKQ